MEDPPDLFQVIAGRSGKGLGKKSGKRQREETKQKTAKKRKPTKSSEDNTDKNESNSQDVSWSPALLHRSAFNAGMLVLGRIKAVGKRSLRISLLNNVEGEVPISEVSESLTKQILAQAKSDQHSNMDSTLHSHFRLGQFIVARVLSENPNSSSDKGQAVRLTMRPAAVYEDSNITRTFASFCESLVLQGAVESVEDHGYLIDLGFSKSFLRCDNTEADKKFTVGDALLCAIENAQNVAVDRVLPVTAQKEPVSKHSLASDARVPIEWLLPGMKVRGRIAAVLSSGIRVTFGADDLYDCYVHRSHLRAKVDYAVGQPCVVRLVVIDRQARRFIGSTLKHIVTLDGSLDEAISGSFARRGFTLRGGSVTRVEPHATLIHFGATNDRTTATDVLVPKAHLVDPPVGAKGEAEDDGEEQDIDTLLYGSKEQKNETVVTMNVGQTVSQCRVLAYSYFDGLVIGTLRKSLLQERYFTLDDVHAGETVQCTMVKFAETSAGEADGQSVDKVSGLVVSISRFVYGFVPRSHLADVPHLAHPDKSFTVGQKLTCRVLKVHRDEADARGRNRLVLTNKRTLVRSRLPVVTSYEQLQVGLVTDCFVMRVANDSSGLIVSFYNDVTAFVPLDHCGVSRVALAEARLETLFRPGSLARCVVLAVDRRRRKALASFRLDAVEQRAAAAAATAPSLSGEKTSKVTPFDERLFDVRIGERVKVVSFERRNQATAGFDVAIQLLTNSADSPLLMAFLPKSQLTDSAELNDAWFRACAHEQVARLAFASRFNLGDEAVCFGKSPQKLVISMRRIVLEHCRLSEAVNDSEAADESEQSGDRIRQSFDQLCVDDVLPGCVTRVLRFGVFAELLGQFVGLAPTHYLTDSFRANRTDTFARYFVPGDTMLFRVRSLKLDKGKPRCLLDSRVSSLRSTPSIDTTIDRLYQTLKLRQQFVACCKSVESSKPQGVDAAWMERCSLRELTIARLTLHKKATVVEAQLNGVAVSSADLLAFDTDGQIDLTALFERHQHTDSGAAECDCVLLSLNKATGQLSVGVSDGLVRDVRARRENKATRVRVGQRIASRVLLITAEFVLVELLAHALGKLAYLPARRLPNDVLHCNAYSIGQSNRVIISRIEQLDGDDDSINGGEMIFCVSEQYSDERADSKSHSADAQPITEIRGISVGAQLNARVVKIRALFVKLAVGAQVGQLHFTELRELDQLVLGRRLGAQINLETTLKQAGFESGKFVSVTVRAIRQLQRVARSSKTILDCSMRRSPVDAARLAPGDLVPVVITSCTNDAVHVLINRSTRGVCYALQAVDSVRKMENLGKFFRTRFAVLARVVRRLGEDAFELSFMEERRVKTGQETIAHVRAALQTTDGRQALRIALVNRTTGLVHLGANTSRRAPEVGSFVRVRVLRVEALRKAADATSADKTDDDRLFYHTVLSDADAETEQLVRRRLASCATRHRKRSDSIGSVSEGGEEGRLRLTSLSDSPVKAGESEAAQTRAARTRRRTESSSSNLIESTRPCLSAVAARIEWQTDAADADADTRAGRENESESESDAENQEDAVESQHKGSQMEVDEAGAVEVDGDDEMATEKRLLQIERAIADGRCEPQTADDFERLVRETPNSSSVWMRFAAHHAEQGRVAAARSVLERALETIAYREQAEKRNCWFALLNLESMFGTAESLETAFARTVQHCQPFAAYSHLVRVLEKAGQLDAAEKRFEEALRRYGHEDTRFWSAFAAFCYRNGRVDKARSALQRSVKVLSKREHVNLIVKFAEFEFKYSDAERGVTLFESVLSSYPKRTDVWSVYIDMLAHASKLDEARALFERILSQHGQPGCPFTKKQLLSVIEKYIRFEERFAPPAKRRDAISRIRQRALALDSL